MAATNIRIMEESAENKTYVCIIRHSVCTNRSDRSAWRCVAQLHGTVARRGSTGQTGGQNRSDRWPKPVRPISTQKSISELKLCAIPLKPNPPNATLKITDAMMHDVMHKSLNQLTYATGRNINSMMHAHPAPTS